MTDDLRRLNRALSGRYRLIDELGRGGMATVYRARDLRHERDVAVKLIRSDVSSAIRTDRFAREIRLAAGLTHPHIVPVFDSGEADGRLFYVMPVVEGESLRARLQAATRLEPDEAAAIAVNVASALDYAHRHGTVHRDIKPENILLHDGLALVADFGVAKAISAASADTGPETAVGMVIGTPAYMSPEQATGQPVDGRSDLYSLGCVLFELLTGQAPFTGSTPQAVILRRLTTTPPPVTALQAGVPASLAGIVATLLRAAPEERFRTGADLIAAIESGQSPVPAAVTAAGTRSIAVLPFANLTGDPGSEYFSDGITEDIMGALARVADLQVASRSSSFAFKGQAVPMSVIAGRLHVAKVVEGSVRRAGDRLRVSVQLVDVATDTHVWSERYDRDMADVFAVQDEIATAIATKLEATLTGGDRRPGATPPTSNLEAYHDYLRGRHLWLQRGRSMAQALPFFQKAVQADPGFAAAHAGLADAYSMLGVWGYVPPDEVRRHADPASRRALELDDRLAEAHAARGAYELYFGWDLAAAERHLRRAIALRPGDGVTRGWLSQLYGFQGRADEAAAIAREARLAEPFSALAQMLAGFGLAFGGHAAEVDAAADQARLVAPDYSPAAQLKGMAALLRGDVDAALPWLERAVDLSGRAPMALAVTAAAYALAGRDAESRQAVDELRRRGQPGMAAWTPLMTGRIDEAMPDLEAAIAQRAPGAWGTASVPLVRGLAADPRWTREIEGLMIGDW
ncbi:MAG: protein kinase [Vicinamibacterales bacterium]